jgi:hypothetical protein
VQIGMASVDSLTGLAHAYFRALPAYTAVRHSALETARRIRRTSLWTPTDGDFAEELARSWSGGHLAMSDSNGAELSVASVVIADPGGTTGGMWPRVIIDARPDMARVEAFLRTLGRDDGGRSRPAA